jgi:hypothetical protein
MLSQGPMRPKLVWVADQSARFPKSIGKGHPIAAIQKPLCLGKKKRRIPESSLGPIKRAAITKPQLRRAQEFF